jgi:hypothetical protein
MNIISHMREGYTRPEIDTTRAPQKSPGRSTQNPACGKDSAVDQLPCAIDKDFTGYFASQAKH